MALLMVKMGEIVARTNDIAEAKRMVGNEKETVEKVLEKGRWNGIGALALGADIK